MDTAAVPLADVPSGASEISRSPSGLGPRLRVTGLRLSRGNRQIAVPDFRVGAGESAALVGPSGSGKTTALMALSLMHPPVDGSVAIDGTEPWTLSRRARDRFRGAHIGLIFQSFHLVDALSVRANIALAARCVGQAADQERLNHLLAQLGLAEVADRRADRISHGQAQRTAVARALMNRPSIILADEPTSALDDRNTEILLSLLKMCAATEKVALLIASHDRRVLDAIDHTVRLDGAA